MSIYYNGNYDVTLLVKDFLYGYGFDTFKTLELFLVKVTELENQSY